jgi:hypothetical protein
MRVVADQQGRELAEVASEAGAELVCGSSLKATLDRDWDQQIQKDEALALVLQVLHTVDARVQRLTDPEDKIVAEPVLAIAKQVQGQDVQIGEEGKVSLIKGVAKDRRISIEDSAKIFSICADALSSTISTSWLVPSRSKLIFRMPLDFLTGALAVVFSRTDVIRAENRSA